MHVFFEPVWKLHIGEIPEKPLLDVDDYNQLSIKGYNLAVEKYNEKIAAIKQNALTVGNPEFLESHFWCGKFEHLNLIEIPPPPDKFYFWPGGYETKEIKDGEIRITAGGHPFLGSKTVAVLTLPEEKKNTMENEFKCMSCGTSINEGEHETFSVCDECYEANYKKQTEASGSVAAPTWYTENEMYHWLIRNNYHENIARELSSKWAADLQGAFNKGFEKGTREIKEREEALKELLPIVEWFTTEYPMDAENLKAKAVIEKARKLLSK